jgi:predicted permease
MELSSEIRQALRVLRNDRLFSVTAIAVLALGIGANTAVFTVVDKILLRPLGYRDSDRLMAIDELVPQIENAAPVPVNARHWAEWKAQVKSFEDVALADTQDYNLTESGEPERVSGARVTPNFFSVAGVAPQLGRAFEEGDDAVVLLTDALWHRRFGGNADVVGRTIVLNGVPCVVAGILPPDFRQYVREALGGVSAQPQVFRAWVLHVENTGWAGDYNYSAIARLRMGVTREQALAELNVVEAGIAKRFEAGVGKMDLYGVLTPLKDRVVERGRTGLLLVLGSVGAVLLIACVNLGNLMLVRASRRGRETAIRTALGAGQWQVMRSVLIESLMVAGSGGVLGVGVAFGLLRMFTAWAPVDLPRADEVAMNPVALLFALGLAMGTVVLFGLGPAWRMAKGDPQEALKSGGRGHSDAGGKLKLRELLVAFEAGLSVALLIVAGLLMASFARVGQVDRGFNSSNVLTAEVSLPLARYKNDEDRRRFYGDLMTRVEARPGVSAAGVISVLPLGAQLWTDVVTAEGDARPIAEKPIVPYRSISPDYFRAMGIPIERGRSIEDRDAPQKTAVISKTAAEKIWPGQDPIGKRFRRGNPKEAPIEVVGIAGDVRGASIEKEPGPMIYVSFLQRTPVTGAIAVRTAGDPVTAVGALREAVHAVDAQMPLSQVRTMVQIERGALAQRTFQTLLAAAFAASALLLALIGLYSVLAYSVAARTNEIGVRMALGAAQGNVVRMVLMEGLRPVLVGLMLGSAGALLAGRMIASLLYSVSAGDPFVFGAVGGVMLVAAAVACVVPARRAAGVSPMEALRYD